MGGTGITDPADIKGQTDLADGEEPYRIEIDDVVAYIKQELIGRIRQYFTSRSLTYSPDNALGTDAYAANSARDAEAHRYWDETSTIVDDVVGAGRKGTPINALDVINSIQSIVRQLARFRVFSKSGKIRYRQRGVCDNGCCVKYTKPMLKDDPSIPKLNNVFLFLPAVSQAYTSISKTVGRTERKDAVANTLDTFSQSVISNQPKAGNPIDATAFKKYIDELYNNWKSFIEANVVSYYNEKCYSTTCNIYVSHCYKSCDGRSRR